MPVQVYSGIEPPNALINEMTKRQGNPQHQADPHNPTIFMHRAEHNSSVGSEQGTELGAAGTLHPIALANATPDEPPPSYEDAMAEDLAPVDGPRREYEQPESRPVGDEKRGTLFGRNERLFS